MSTLSVEQTPHLDPAYPGIATGSAGALALEAADVYATILGEHGIKLLSAMAETHRPTYEHGFRTGVLALAVAAETRIDDWQTAELVVAHELHDMGKYHTDILPLVAFPGYFSDAQREAMRRHAPLGERELLEASQRVGQEGDHVPAHMLEVAAWVAGRHHQYDIAPPIDNDPESMWRWVIARTVQIVDRVDALTSSTSDRTYRRDRRQRGDGGRDGLQILEDNLQHEYGDDATRPLPVLGISPRDVTEIAIMAKFENYKAVVT